jgi:Rieske Fe-S protein
VTEPRTDPRDVPVGDPVWRRDFPLTSSGEDEVTRREFVRFLVLASGGFAAGNVGIALWSSLRTVNTGDPRPIVALDQVPVGTAYLFSYPMDSDPAILVHLPDDELRAFSQKCTHLGCVVYYQPERGEMECPCHEGHFDADTGAVIAGPPQRPLGRIDVEVRDGTVWALGAPAGDAPR